MGAPQEVNRHVKAPLSNSKSTSDARQALEANGKFAVKTGQFWNKYNPVLHVRVPED